MAPVCSVLFLCPVAEDRSDGMPVTLWLYGGRVDVQSVTLSGI